MCRAMYAATHQNMFHSNHFEMCVKFWMAIHVCDFQQFAGILRSIRGVRIFSCHTATIAVHTASDTLNR